MKVNILTLSFLAILGTSTAVEAQEWSKAQMEVWNSVEGYTKAFQDQDMKAIAAAFHDDFSGWGSSAPLPDTKSSRMSWLELNSGRSKMLKFELKPVGINLFGNTAIVQYYYVFRMTNNEDERTTSRGHYTDILQKQGKKWVLIGDHGSD